MMISVSDELLRSLMDRDDCRFDHHGGCQAHGYLSLEPGETCPQRDLKTILEQAEAGAPEVATFDAADYGISWPNTPKGIVEEALREFVGDGEGADGAVLAAFVNEVRASAEAEIAELRADVDLATSQIQEAIERRDADHRAEVQRVMVASHRYASDREDLQQQVMALEEKVAEAEKDEETSRSVANFLSQKISAFQYSRDQARNELHQRELHHFETEQENEALKAQIARMQTSLEACPYGEEGHVLCDCARVERERVRTLEKQASNLQMLVEDLESSFETLAVGHERSHSSYLRGTEAANEIRLVLRQVADRAAERG
jgi:hypothetical protein